MWRLRDVNWKDAIKPTLVKDGWFDEWYGCEVLELTDDDIKNLATGEILHAVIEGEYAILIRLKESR